MVSLHKPDHTCIMSIAIRQRLCRSIGSVVWLMYTNYLSARYTLMGFGPTQRSPTFKLVKEYSNCRESMEEIERHTSLFSVPAGVGRLPGRIGSNYALRSSGTFGF